MRKKFDLFNRFSVRLIVLMMSVCFVITSCSAKSNVSRISSSTSKDSIVRETVGDSIYSILTKSRKVTATLRLKTHDNKRDSIVNVKINKYDRYLLKFILTDPMYYDSDSIVYGRFLPNFSLKFYASKGRNCTANFDFGLRKWNIKDCKGNELASYDLPFNQVLRMANVLFPDCEYFNNLLNKLQK